MNQVDPVTMWTIIVGLAVGSYTLRFVFIGFVGDRRCHHGCCAICATRRLRSCLH